MMNYVGLNYDWDWDLKNRLVNVTLQGSGFESVPELCLRVFRRGGRCLSARCNWLLTIGLARQVVNFKLNYYQIRQCASFPTRDLSFKT